MSVVSNKKKKKKKQPGKISTYHAQEPFCMKEDFTPPKISQLHHIFKEQKGLLQRRGNVTTYTPIEVPDWCIIHQGLTTKHGSWKPCLGLGELIVCPFWTSARGMASFLLLRCLVSFLFIWRTRSSSLHCLFPFRFPPSLRITLFGFGR